MSFQHNPARYIPPPSSGPSTRSPSPTACAPGHTAARMQARPASHGSRTQVITADEAPEQGAGSGADDVVGVLKLRGARVGTGRKVKWVNGVVDNEGMGRKKSKICCIYHKPRAFDESSSSSSSSSSESDEGPNNPPRIQKLAKRRGSSSSGSDGPSDETPGAGRKGKGKELVKEGAGAEAVERDADGFVIVRKAPRARRGSGEGSSASDSESSSDGGLGDGSARPTRKNKPRHDAHNHAHPRTSDCEADEAHGGHTHRHHHHHRRGKHGEAGAGGVGTGKAVHPNAIKSGGPSAKPNKYEVQP